MLQRLFRSKSSRDSEENYTRLLLEPEPWSLSPLADGQVRILLCQDAGDANKTILYDSCHGLAPSPIVPAKKSSSSSSSSSSSGSSSMRNAAGIARSWNGNDEFHNGRRSNALFGYDRRTECRPSSMRMVSPSLPLTDHPLSSSPHRHPRQVNRRLDLIGDMIFGTAPLAYKGMNTKVHYKRDKDQQIVLSKLFTLNTQDSDAMRRASFSSINSDWSTTSSIHYAATAPPTTITADPYAKRSVSTLSMSLDDNASEISSDDDKSHYSGYSFYPSTFGLRSSSRESFHSKRSRRFSQTSMEDGIFRPMPLPNAMADLSTTPTATSTSATHANGGGAIQHGTKTAKYAVALIITLDDKNKNLFDFIFSHFSLIENHLHQLQASTFRLLNNHLHNTDGPQQIKPRRLKNGALYLEPGIFQHEQAMMDAVIQFKRAFYDLYGTPRIQEPLWLNMSTFPHRRSEYGQMLFKELAYLIGEHNTESRHHFISTLVTAVLTFHLSWVHTVVPPGDFKNINCRHGNYDPLWAQLSDLYGFVGNPGRITRTIVVGKNASLVRRILYILTYLIRCNEVYENLETRSESDSGNIFSHEREMDNTYASRLEDKIVKQLVGSTTDVESIAIPRTQDGGGSSSGGNGNGGGGAGTVAQAAAAAAAGTETYYPSSESPESITDNRSSTSFGSSTAHQWSTSNDHPIMESRARPPTARWSSSSSSNDEPPVVSASGTCSISMPKSSIYRMIPDITQVQEEDTSTTERADTLYAKSYGRSLMATFCEVYKPDFVLMGVPTDTFAHQVEADLKNMLQQFTLSDGVTDAACLIIDTNKFQCRIMQQSAADLDATSSDKHTLAKEWQLLSHSSMIHELLTTIKQKHGTGASADELIDLFEDGLQMVYLKSLFLQESVTEWLVTADADPINDLGKIVDDIGANVDDIPLLANVCGTYDNKIPRILLSADS